MEKKSQREAERRRKKEAKRRKKEEEEARRNEKALKKVSPSSLFPSKLLLDHGLIVHGRRKI